ncbi:hypothetical protein DH96_01360 [Candidatus Phytoplasma oryzae]|uniref:tRNA(Ile)-lysidine synthase n=1 Tax=Candidatus Phytoplasma oryzae TaxID=203274 RepID=A0A328IJ18_9MOLU|nr:tRNA lysidine(34) synthetase TilS [Candidatus Phytoplasma oryzae]RAM57735.1 hypothetical protein DH96_01360 [Candidatus Phytoplasma oryzae]
MLLSLNLDKRKEYVISVSGGVDSMVLLDVLYHKKYKLIVVHFNHLVRPNSFQDKNIIQEYCRNKNIIFHYFELNIRGKNFHHQARILRLEKLKKIASKYKTKYLITAHHLDDLSETIFLKILRGSSLLGYSGMKNFCFYNDFILLKPFLYIKKKKIIEYAEKNKIYFLEDYTNKQNIYLRNQLRNQIIPFFKQKYNFLKNIKKFHFQIDEVSNFIRNQTFLFLKEQNIENILSLKKFYHLDIVVQKDIIIYLLEQKKINKNFFLINSIIKGLNNIKKAFIIWKLDQKNILVKQYDHFCIKNQNLEKYENQILKEKKPLLHCSKKKMLISFCSIIQKIYYDENNFFPPFFLRKRKSGDILKFSFGTQKLKNFFINKKVILPQRDNIWLVLDQKKNIIWIPKFYVNHMLGNEYFCYLGLE